MATSPVATSEIIYFILGLIQIMAASAAHRDMLYFTFEDMVCIALKSTGCKSIYLPFVGLK